MQPEDVSWPSAFEARLGEIFGASRGAEVQESFHAKRRPCFRVNPMRTEIAAVVDELRDAGLDPSPVPWLESAFTCPVETREQLTHSDAASQGKIYIQNAASLLPGLILDPQPGERVLDLAAAPGGKTLHLAARMAGRGELAAVEKSRPRFFRLKDNLRRHGADFVRTFLMDGCLVEKKTPGRFDRVLLDAPCSSEARFDVEEPETFARWSERKVREMARKQHRLLRAAIVATKPGGHIVYSTCSFSPEENEAVVDQALRLFPDQVELLEIDLSLPNRMPGLTAFRGHEFSPAVSRAMRVLPDDSCHGFFVAHFHKRSSEAK